MTHRLRLFLGSLLLACAGDAAAQAEVAPLSNGPLVGLPAMFSVSADTKGPASDDRRSEGYYKRIGFETTAPVAVLDSGVSVVSPDFSAKALLRAAACGAGKDLPDIDAFSIGYDWITVEGKGVVRVPPGHWSGIVFSVARGVPGTRGQILGETTRTESYRGASADMFSYIYRGSSLPPALVDRTQRANDASEFPLAADAELDAIDVFASLFRLGIDAYLGIDRASLAVYFSVSAATVADVPAAWWGAAPKSGATILVVEWDDTAKGWKCPKPAFTPAQLGLLDTDDVDAFSYDKLRGRALVSITSTRLDPILFVEPGTAPAAAAIAYPVIYANDDKVSDLTGIGAFAIGNVDAICSLDPGAMRALQFTMGRPVSLPLPPGNPLEIQSYRDIASPNNPGQHVYRFLVAGGYAGGFGLPFVAPDLAGPWFALHPVAIPQAPLPHGFPAELVLPPIPANHPPLQLMVIWGSVPQNLLGPVRVSLPLAVFV